MMCFCKFFLQITGIFQFSACQCCCSRLYDATAKSKSSEKKENKGSTHFSKLARAESKSTAPRPHSPQHMLKSHIPKVCVIDQRDLLFKRKEILMLPSRKRKVSSPGETLKYITAMCYHGGIKNAFSFKLEPNTHKSRRKLVKDPNNLRIFLIR